MCPCVSVCVGVCVTVTGGPAVTSCFGFIGQGLNIWSCFWAQPFLPSACVEINRLQLVEHNSLLLLLLQGWHTVRAEVGPVLSKQSFPEEKWSLLKMWEVDDNVSGWRPGFDAADVVFHAATLKQTPQGVREDGKLLFYPFAHQQIRSSAVLTQLRLHEPVWRYYWLKLLFKLHRTILGRLMIHKCNKPGCLLFTRAVVGLLNRATNKNHIHA